MHLITTVSSRAAHSALAFAILLSVVPAYSAIIPADRITDWTPGTIVGVPGGIPSRTDIFVNLKTTTNGNYKCAADGVTDDSGKIGNAIRDCPAGKVVYAPAGTYLWAHSVSQNYQHSNYTLRGDGPGRTIFKGTVSESGGQMFISGTIGDPESFSITGGATKGSTTITVSDSRGTSNGGPHSFNGIQAGKTILIYANSGPSYYHPLNFTNKNLPGLGWVFKCTAVTKTSISFTPPLPLDISSFGPTVGFFPTGGLYALVEGIGLEDFSVDMSAMTAGWFWTLEQAWGCWFKDIETTGAPTKQIYWSGVGQSEIRHCYFHNAGGGSSHEGVDLATYACWNLIEDNICNRAGEGQIVISDAGVFCGGNVIAYNYLTNIDVGDGGKTAGGDIALNHGAHPSFNLIEGNVMDMIQSDGYFGSSSHGTIFRNWITVNHPTATLGMRGIDLAHYSNYFNVVGNIIGSPNFSGRYDIEDRNYDNGLRLIYRLGYPNLGNTCYGITGDGPGPGSRDIIVATTPPDYTNEPYMLGSCGQSGAQNLDLNVKNTILRHGNYDYFNKDTLWDSSISDHTIPNSLYLTKKPSWWLPSLAWPTIGPDKVPMTGTIPAMIRYQQGGGKDVLPASGLRIVKPS